MTTRVNANIATEGLAFIFDEGNPRSNKGHPTINRINGENTNASLGRSDLSTVAFDSISRTLTNTYDAGPGRRDVIRFVTTAAGYLGVLFNYGSVDNQSGERYTLSFDFKWITGEDNSHYIEPVNTNGIVYGDGYKTPDSANTASSVEKKKVYLGDGWYRYYFTYVAGYTGRNQVRFNFNASGADRNDGIATALEFMIDNIQYEVGYESDFIPANVSRSVTKSMINVADVSSFEMNNDNVYYDSNKEYYYGYDKLTQTDSAAYYTQINTPSSFDSYFDYVYSFNVWIRLDDPTNYLSNNPFVWSVGAGVGYSHWFSFFQTTGRNFTAQFGAKNSSNSSPANTSFSMFYDLGDWVNFCGTLDFQTGDIKIYKNGSLSTSSTFSYFTKRTDGSAIRVGRRYDGGNNFIGRIPYIAFYDRALTASEVNQNFQAMRHIYGV